MIGRILAALGESKHAPNVLASELDVVAHRDVPVVHRASRKAP
jgi:hypothetical protein